MKHYYEALLYVLKYYYVCPHATAIRVLILLHVSPYYYYMCPHTSTICVLTLLDVWAEGCQMSGEVWTDLSACAPRHALCVFSCYYSICVLILVLYLQLCRQWFRRTSQRAAQHACAWCSPCARSAPAPPPFSMES